MRQRRVGSRVDDRHPRGYFLRRSGGPRAGRDAHVGVCADHVGGHPARWLDRLVAPIERSSVRSPPSVWPRSRDPGACALSCRARRGIHPPARQLPSQSTLLGNRIEQVDRSTMAGLLLSRRPLCPWPHAARHSVRDCMRLMTEVLDSTRRGGSEKQVTTTSHHYQIGGSLSMKNDLSGSEPVHPGTAAKQSSPS